MNLPQTAATNIARVAELIRGLPACMLTTILPDGSPHARPMAAQERAFDGFLWFLAHREDRLVREVQANPHVGVTFSDPESSRWVSLSGSARIVEDRALIEELWKEPLETWFPLGPQDRAISLVQVEPQEGWFWVGAPASAPGAFELALAVLSGKVEAPDRGASGTVTF